MTEGAVVRSRSVPSGKGRGGAHGPRRWHTGLRGGLGLGISELRGGTRGEGQQISEDEAPAGAVSCL